MNTASKKVILLMNLGSPDSTSVKDVRRYLNQFLMDGKVIDMPLFTRALLVRGIIVPFRAPKSAKAYRSIWTDDGSPLIHLTRQLRDAMQVEMNVPVEICMRYGNPSPKKALDDIRDKYPDAEEVILFPLYPHYAMSSYETAVEYAQKYYDKGNYPFQFTVIDIFYNDPAYIKALSASIEPYLQADYDQILFSYHGIPERHVMKTDVTKSHCLQVANCCDVPSKAHETCYRHQVFTTTKLVAAKLGIAPGKYATSFQSRLGRDEWLKPYTAVRLQELPKEGVKKLLVVCPAFISDCLETLEEMGEEGKEIFLDAGGESFTLIPCLNVQPGWISAAAEIIRHHSQTEAAEVN